MAGFFPKSKMVERKAPPSLVARCGACGLFQSCQSPKMEAAGKGRRNILIIGEAPGKTEDEEGRHFCGDSGRLLEETLNRLGINMRRDCTLTNALICRPGENTTPTGDQIDFCRPNLAKTIARINPEVIIPLGTGAVQALMPIVYKDSDIGGITKWSGWKIPCQKVNAWICPTFHPASILYEDEKRNPVLKMLFQKHLAQAVKIDSRPWKEVPDWKSEIEVIHSPKKAARAIRELQQSPLIAFDYESTCLKPELPGAAIVCCSISNGKRTIAYPWLEPAVSATYDLLRDKSVWKIAANLKNEERWTEWAFGKPVRNWFWDTVVDAHLLDNRPNITSVKFQSFALLGFESYDDHIRDFLKGDKETGINRIQKEIDPHQLLVYCGLDSLLEYKIAKKQIRAAGYPYPWARQKS